MSRLKGQKSGCGPNAAVLKRVRKIMKAKGVSYQDIANSTGLRQAYIANLTSGKDKSPQARALIEQFLGEPIWTEKKPQTQTKPLSCK